MIEIYGTQTCGFCLRAKKLAERYSLAYNYKDIQRDEGAREELEERLGQEVKQIPQIFWHGKYVGGYNQLAEEIQNTRNYGDGAI